MLHNDYWVFEVNPRPFEEQSLRSLRTMADRRITQYISPGAWALVSPSSITQARTPLTLTRQVDPLFSDRARSILTTLIDFVEVSRLHLLTCNTPD
jgi:hypothetical protein